MEKHYRGAGTLAIHGGRMADQFNALSTPIYQSALYSFDTCQDGGDGFSKIDAGTETCYIYPRYRNPTTEVLEKKVALLEGAEAGIAMGSGMAAVSSTLWAILKPGDHFIADVTMYSATYSLMTRFLNKFGIESTFLETGDVEAIKKALRPETAIMYVETPTNPTLKIVDIKAIVDVVRAYNPAIRIVADNTFATPYCQNPLKLGCDIVINSATKYLNGHGDVCAGIICADKDFIQRVRSVCMREVTGAVLGQQESYLVIRGLKTFGVRMERHCTNAMKLAEYLHAHPKVEKVFYPGLPSDPGHDIAKKQMHNGFGGMVSFEVKGGKQAAIDLVNNLQVCVIATSLGDAETLVEHPATMSHFNFSKEELVAAGISEGFIRVSVGLEEIEDIIGDWEQSLAKL